MTKPLVIACGALASDLRAVLAQLGLADSVDVTYLPAPHHSRPERIVPAIREQLARDDDGERTILFGYGDCGTGGHLDRLLDEMGGRATRLPGDHCYEFMAGSARFAALHDAEPGTFYLTDFLAKHFDALVWAHLGLDRHPELRDAYFGNYTRIVLLSQTDDVAVVDAGRRAADMLGLEFEHIHVARGPFTDAVAVSLTAEGRLMPRSVGRGSEVVTIYWRDIPAQVNGQSGRDRHQVLLSSKFQRAVDRAKRKAGIYTAEEDIAQWRRTSEACENHVFAAEAQAAALEAEYSKEYLGKLAYAGGFVADMSATDVDRDELLALEELEDDEQGSDVDD